MRAPTPVIATQFLAYPLRQRNDPEGPLRFLACNSECIWEVTFKARIDEDSATPERLQMAGWLVNLHLIRTLANSENPWISNKLGNDLRKHTRGLNIFTTALKTHSGPLKKGFKGTQTSVVYCLGRNLWKPSEKNNQEYE